MTASGRFGLTEGCEGAKRSLEVREPRFEVRVSRSSLTTWDCETRSEISEAVSASEKVAKFAGCVTVIHGFGRAAFRGLRLFTEVRGR